MVYSVLHNRRLIYMDIMINFTLLIVASVLFFIVGFFIGRILLERIGTTKILEAEERAVQIIQEAQREAQELRDMKVAEANDEWKRKKREFDQEVSIKNNKFSQTQKQIRTKEETLNRRGDQLQKRERALDDQNKELAQKMQYIEDRGNELEQLLSEQNQRLISISGLNAEEAKAMLIDNMISKAKEESAEQIKAIYEETEKTAQKTAQKIILQSIQRVSIDQTSENAISVVHLQNDELKGRIIGREGRNIKAFENTTGVDIIVDDTPEVVILSCFDPVRRELAKLTLQKLLVDGIIHPAAIEKAFEESEKELEEIIISTGEDIITSLEIPNIHPDLMRLIGKMKYRTTYGQNLLQHSKEVAMIAGLMAAELKLDTKLAKRAGLLHTIGLMLDQPDQPYAIAGMEFLKKYRENNIVLNAVGAHNGDVPKEHPIAELVEAANVISSSRPGARGAITPEGYIRRLESLEEIAKTFPGVQKTYALQAGREIRVIVEGTKVSDAEAEVLAHDIADKIQNTVEYPGQIKISVVRERRNVAYAK